MGTLLPFKPDPTKRRRTFTDEGAKGEVLIFTGVRYERETMPALDVISMHAAGGTAHARADTRTAG
jgi:hypothetical protein